jgi:hypothetical protein
VAVLSADASARAGTAAVALALARLLGRGCAIAATLGAIPEPSPLRLPAPAARSAAARLRGRGDRAQTCGRLVWLEGAWPAEADPAGAAAAASAALGRAARSLGVPAALAIPLARTAAVDRVLRWHDGIVVVRESGTVEHVPERVLASLRELGCPVVELSRPGPLAAATAAAGLVAPAAAVQAVAALGLGGAPGGRR